ncbi:hypothetical protein XaclCFBP3371_04435 [Xanthomonas euvesicatoria pv. citrumelonis]|nr:hypothetical protein XaclCFBP3371_04435 [Xanthomonas euvesicatoria pv. citrumelonis]TKA15719.1 hypothetical protein TN51_14450 [Xanthomonas euvesicatoria pv. citrumelonis]
MGESGEREMALQPTAACLRDGHRQQSFDLLADDRSRWRFVGWAVRHCLHHRDVCRSLSLRQAR